MYGKNGQGYGKPNRSLPEFKGGRPIEENNTFKQLGKAVLALILLVGIGLLAPFPILCILSLMAQPFTGFTFTDLVDWIPVSLIATAATLLFARVPGAPERGERWYRWMKGIAFFCAVCSPVPTLACLYLLSSRALQLIGHWPQYMLDDPKYIGADDPLFQDLTHKLNYVSAYSGATIWIFSFFCCIYAVIYPVDNTACWRYDG